MNDIKNLLTHPHELLLDVLQKIDANAHGVAILVDEDNKLLGVLTDGDVRRFILSRGDLTADISKIYNKQPIYAFIGESRLYYKNIMLERGVNVLPVVNAAMQVLEVLFLEDCESLDNKIQVHDYALENNAVVIMAGGCGTRLYPYTQILPKPLMPIGKKPISERIIDQFAQFGCSEFYFSVNYKANMIRAYYADIEKSYKVNYIQEDEPLGTAGSLYLLKGKITDTFFVVNCDIIINANYQKIFEFHKKTGNKITIVGAVKDYQIPYGVIDVCELSKKVVQITEKPTYNIIANTGMYILEPEVLERVPENKFYHLTHLIENLLKAGERVGVYPVHSDSWLDMGQLEEMQEMLQKLGSS